MDQQMQIGSQGPQGNAGGPGQSQGQNSSGMSAQRQAAIAQLMKQAPYSTFIKPDQFTMANFGATNLNQDQLNQYKNGFTKLWDNVFKHPRDHPMHQSAVAKLGEASTKLFREYHRVKAEKAAVPSDQPSQQTNNLGQDEQKDMKVAGGISQQQFPQQIQSVSNSQQGSGQGAPMPNGQQRQPDLPPEIKAQAEKMIWTLPAQMQEGTAEAQNWRIECSRRYGEALYKRSRSGQVVRECDEFIVAAKRSGADVGPANERRAQYQKHFEEASAFVEKLLATEKHNRLDRARLRQGPAQAQTQQSQPLPLGNQSAQSPQIRQGANQIPTGAGRGGEIPINRPSSSSSAQALQQQGLPQTIGQAVQQGQQQPQSAPNSAGPRPPPQPIHTNQQLPVQNNNTQSPTPLSHSQAIAASSRSYSAQQQTAPQSAQHFQQHRNSLSGDMDTRNPGQPIQKNWTPQPPQPVGMGSSRPTLSGANNGPLGAMGQPAIQKPDTFLLQGPGDRVLDKKKLDELVRQVCGADAGESDALLPEVEESVLQLADEFIDNVVTSACKLAKLRGATTLEIRDIQLVLERQYNIRIPGYATDEVRTVRKTQPAQGYYQKMNAIQAAKVMGGKPDV